MPAGLQRLMLIMCVATTGVGCDSPIPFDPPPPPVPLPTGSFGNLDGGAPTSIGQAPAPASGFGLPHLVDFEFNKSLEPDSFVGQAAFGDLNGDPIADVAIQETGTGTCLRGSLTANWGDGGGDVFRRATYRRIDPDTALPSSDFKYLLADVDGDGRDELVSCGRCGRIARDCTLPIPVGMLADFNRDHKVDVYDGRDLWMGRGDATFSQVAGVPQGATVATDLSGDGAADLVTLIAGAAPELRVWINRGDGTFAPPMSIALSDRAAACIKAADLDGDGRLDLVAGHDVHLNLGGGAFGPLRTSPVAACPGAVGDFDGDGKADLVTDQVYLGRGDGTFGPQSVGAAPVSGTQYPAAVIDNRGAMALYANGGHGEDSRSWQWLRRYGHSTEGALPGPLADGSGLAGDVDGDGVTDMILVDALRYDVNWGTSIRGTGEVTIVLGARDRGLKQLVQAPLPLAAGAQVVSGDFNGDRRADLALLTRDGALHAWLGNGGGGFVHVLDRAVGPGSLALADINGDGALDLLVGSAVTTNAFLGGNNGGFNSGVQSPAIEHVGPLGDVDGDGKLDVIEVMPSSSRVWLGSGDGRFHLGSDTQCGEAGYERSTVLTDFDGDGHLDLAQRSMTSSGGGRRAALRFCRGSGGGDFEHAQDWDLGSLNEKSALLTADLDGDSLGDLIVFGTAETLVFGNRAHALPPLKQYHGGGGQPPILGDFDGDGVLDLALASDKDHPLRVRYGARR